MKVNQALAPPGDAKIIRNECRDILDGGAYGNERFFIAEIPSVGSAPDTLGFFLPVVVQTTQGVSNDDITIEILGIPSSPPGVGNQAHVNKTNSMHQLQNECHDCDTGASTSEGNFVLRRVVTWEQAVPPADFAGHRTDRESPNQLDHRSKRYQSFHFSSKAREFGTSKSGHLMVELYSLQ